jgi:hypothetical protein
MFGGKCTGTEGFTSVPYSPKRPSALHNANGGRLSDKAINQRLKNYDKKIFRAKKFSAVLDWVKIVS